MARKTIGKPRKAPAAPFPDEPETLHKRGGWLWIPLRREWRDAANAPEEVVRQRFIRRLHDDYGYTLDRLDQERRTVHGRRSPRADIVV